MRKNGSIYIFVFSFAGSYFEKVLLVLRDVKSHYGSWRREMIVSFFQMKLMAIVFLVETLLLVNKSNEGIECDNV